MMLSLSKRIVEVDKALRRDEPFERVAYKGGEVFGKTVGIIGIGHVGSKLASMCRSALGMTAQATMAVAALGEVFELLGLRCTHLFSPMHRLRRNTICDYFAPTIYVRDFTIHSIRVRVISRTHHVSTNRYFGIGFWALHGKIDTLVRCQYGIG